ncbi:sugar phosphatase [Providencia alcalifaciens]|uniref:Phosphatase YfbT n=1 Tax=Providencia alcalifaciens 205/92 TaxID=1256988 RepID=A0AAV3M3B3_9GAMM|nr:sugar phosphatase [Providencia alcalifaciens]EKT67287.1 putative phosphatase [Providencia alcalifaciens Dmel2]EUD08170.1 phosphatase YfbT [Providencia alcalifaciens R90-1475]EUD10225.1 phosphatase YfbT [Providencia alcalifaciens 205/92]MTC16787.1 sugar phosphatase [Providencia alcalifaciens]MTC63916.1 sugar phosphatase [Providencia alcalifaciens]
MKLKAKGFLFDLDGTLADSLAVVERCWCLFGDRIGEDKQAIIDYIHGKPAMTTLRHFLPHASEEELQSHFRWLEKMESEDMDGVVALPGAIALLSSLNKLGAPWAIVTSGTVPIAHGRRAAAGLPEPKHWVTFEKVSKGKPDPEPFQLGAKSLSLPPEDCIAFEDAPAGIHSALSAGCQVIAVHAPEGMPRRDEISAIISTLEQISVTGPDNNGYFELFVSKNA